MAVSKMDDCYFYYYSSCVKGDACPFRHEPSALGKETVCNFWKQGKCSRSHCNFRHMDVVVDRTKIPCYWEAQPTGCRKPHCPFSHSNTSNLQCNPDIGKDLILPVSAPSIDAKDSTSVADLNPRLISNFDPLVVDFEEESDNESVPSVSPMKRFRNAPKTLEQIRLEKIQEESAAFYNYENQQFVGRESTLANRLDIDFRQKLNERQESSESRQIVVDDNVDLRSRMLARKMQQQEEAQVAINTENIKVLSLKEIREQRRRKQEEEESEGQSNSRLPKQKITFTMDVEDLEFKMSPTKRKIEAVAEEEEVEEEEEEVEVEFEETKRHKRAHSPVVFDLSGKVIKKEKKSKSEKRKKKHKKEKKDPPIPISLDNGKFENFQVTANLTSPSKPTVVVLARKRVVAEEPGRAIEPVKKIKRDRTEKRLERAEKKLEKAEKRPERPLWRPSRLAKSIEISEAAPKITIRPRMPIQAPKVEVTESKAPSRETTPVEVPQLLLSRKIRLKRPAPISPPPMSPPPRDEPSLSPQPDPEYVPVVESCSSSNLVVEIPKTPPPQLSHQDSMDDEFDLLSPYSDQDGSFVKTTDEKILEDIDALLNE